MSESINKQVIAALTELKLPIDVSVTKSKGADAFLVINPQYDTPKQYADDVPQTLVQEIELALYKRGNYLELKDKIMKYLITAGITVSDGRYIEYETDTKYHHYVFELTVVDSF